MEHYNIQTASVPSSNEDHNPRHVIIKKGKPGGTHTPSKGEIARNPSD